MTMPPAKSALNRGEEFTFAFCTRHKLRAERFSKAEIRSGKTPDFRVYKDDQFVFYCEAKHVQHDDWLDKQLSQAQSLEIVGGLRHDPVFNRLAGHIHQAAKQFQAVNPDHHYPNVLVFLNSDRHCGFADLLSTLTGNFYAEGGSVEAIYTNVSEGRIRKEKLTIDLYVWFEEQKVEQQKGSFFFTRCPKHYEALASLLGSDPAKHRRV